MSTLALCVAVGLSTVSPVSLASEAEDVQALRTEMEELKQRYVEEVRRLREVDARLMAVQARIEEAEQAPDSDETVAEDEQPAPAEPAEAQTPRTSEGEDQSQVARTEADKEQATRRSADDLLDKEHVAFDRPFVLEAGVEYRRYDRSELTLDGFLALDSIFLGNIAVNNVASDTLEYTLAARYSITPRWKVGVSVPFLQRHTTYQKGGAGGAADARAEVSDSSDLAIGDTTMDLSYRLLPETRRWPDIVLTGSVSAPTGREPYGIDVDVIQESDDPDSPEPVFAIPTEQATGNGVWGYGLSVSAVKSLDPALLFADLGYTYYGSDSFDDVDSDPDTVTPGDVDLGDSWQYGLGLAFALNDRTSLSMAFTQEFTQKAKIREEGENWESIIGSDSSSAMFDLGLTYALTPKSTIVTTLGIGLTQDAPDFSLGVRVPYQL
ncbi:transporter [Guyparkeria sp.]|uniref:transporter n=1 Tax=Guyparkeria sp. TaxID=2035736 RepID=UPI00397C35F6